ncbi:hypothetical protein ACFFQW_07830 [Umezawaea endophytica]|uniref:Uncharacterized protein n=1 Tax=Umezawaea endophytica TaxID=1654476 RepID=A0A9X2VPX1_9PSEU|nr:hypothetical protein [Umezawaea endophytica]MCS7479992.1 hypothetical protein [Umezawaea endophytica]
MNELGTAMRRASEDVDVRAGFTGDVLRGGRRRQARRRTGLAITIAAVVGVVGFGAGVLVQAWQGPKPQDQRLLEATKGDLADDPARLAAAAGVWQRALTMSWRYDRGVTEVHGQPYVYWAATTTAGEAAVVMQEARVRDQVRTLVGLVGRDPADDEQKLLGSTSPGDLGGDKESFQFGPGDRTFLVVDPMTPVYASASSTRDADGVVRRTWQEVPIVDGVALWTAPEGTDPSTARLVSGDGPPTTTNIPRERQLPTCPASGYLRYGQCDITAYADTKMWDSTPRPDMPVGPAGSGPPEKTDVYSLLRAAGLVDVGATIRFSEWTVRGSTPDGTSLLVGEFVEDPRPSALYAVLFRANGTPDRVLLGPAVDVQSPVPVRLRLPDGHGWVVASDRTVLRYRTSTTGDWQGSYTYAAVIPDDAVQVEADGQVVDLVP